MTIAKLLNPPKIYFWGSKSKYLSRVSIRTILYICFSKHVCVSSVYITRSIRCVCFTDNFLYYYF